MGSTTTQQIIALALGLASGSLMIAILVLVPKLRRKKRSAHKPTAATSSATASASESAAPNSELDTFNAAAGLTSSMLAVIISFFYGTIALFVYRVYAPTTLVWFGVMEILWFLIGFFVYALQKIVSDRKLREKQ